MAADRRAPDDRGTGPTARSSNHRLRNTTLPALGCISVLALANQNWLLTPAGFLDPWIYVNYFRVLAGPPGWEDYYKVSRVPWTAVGHVATSLFGLEAVQYVLALASMVALVVLVAVLLRPLAIEAAVFGVALVALYPLFHGSGGWLYQNTLSGPLQVAAMLVGLRLALCPRWPGRVSTRVLCWFCFGFLVVTLAITNTMQVLAVVPVVVVIVVVVLRRGTSWLHALRGTAAATLGGAAAFLGSAAVSVAGGGRFLFYLPLYREFTSLSSTTNGEQWYQPLSTGWWRDATYLVLPLGAGIIGLVQVVGWVRANRRRPGNPAAPADTLALALIAVHLMVLTGWIVMYAMKFHLLNYAYHSYPILLTSALSLAGSVQLGFARRGLTDGNRRGRLSVWFPWLAVAVPTFLLLFPLARASIEFSSADLALRGSLLGGLTVLGGLALAFRLVRSRRALLVVLLVSLGLLIGTGSYGNYALLDRCDAARLANSAITDIAELHEPSADPVLIYASGTSKARLGQQCVVPVQSLTSSLSEINPFVLYAAEVKGAPQFRPRALPELPAAEAPQTVLFIRPVSSRPGWEPTAVRALTGGRPERVIGRSVRPIGSPTGKLEIVELTIA